MILILLGMHAVVLHAADLSQEAAYHSLEEFVNSAKAFRPSLSKGEFQKFFSIPELGEIAQEEIRPVRIADSVMACETVWSVDRAAVVFVTARPPTEATPSEIGLLIYVERAVTGWKIKDVSRFIATGKYARITAELTAAGGSGSAPSTVSAPPIVTVKEFQGGRGQSFDLSASYTVKAQKIVRLDLN